VSRVEDRGSGISGVVLAAGLSRRFVAEHPKQLALFHGVPLVRRAVEAALGSRLDELIVVVGHAVDAVLAALADLDLRAVINPDFAAGQSTSVRQGLAHVSPSARGAMFLPCDQPLLSAALVDRLIEAHARHAASIVSPSFLGRHGTPVLWDRCFFPELASLRGDTGGRSLLQHHQQERVLVPLDDEAPLLDVDTADDLARLQRAFPSPAPPGNS